MTKLFLIFLTLIIAVEVSAQTTSKSQDSVLLESYQGDTVLIKSYAKRYNPRKALLYAAIFPGLGQVYTKKYWKLPLVYGGFYAIGYGLNFYNEGYRKYKGQLFENLEKGLNENPAYPFFTTDQLRTIVDRYRRQRDFMIILMGGMYLLQIVDAHVDAHLKEFDLNPKLQVSIEPTMQQDALIGRTTGVALVFKF